MLQIINFNKVLLIVMSVNTLSECMILHKRIWRKGFRNANFGPDKYGMFRTKDINLMTINEVYIMVLIL